METIVGNSILRRVTEDNGRLAGMQLAAERAAAKEAYQRRMEVDRIISEHVQEIAKSLGVDVESLTPAGTFPRRFRLGDILISIQPFQQSSGSMNPERQRLLLNEFCVWLLAIDGGHVSAIRSGMLGTFCYESIFQLVRSYPQCDFEAAAVQCRLEWHRRLGD